MLKRFFDILIAGLMLVLLGPIIILAALAVFFGSRGGVLYWSKRVGRNGQIFIMPKFRSMQKNTPEVATHLLVRPEQHVTRVGRILRKTSLDELPQLWSVLVGHMSLVGPRPALSNEVELIQMRQQRGIDSLKPGLTGWAQINGRDLLNGSQKVMLDEYYLQNKGLALDFKIMCLTPFKIVLRQDITH